MSSSGTPTLSLYGVDISRQGSATDFSVPFIVLNMIGGGLSWFVAISWSNAFQSALDQRKTQAQSEGRPLNPVWLNFSMALTATFFTLAVMYLMVRLYPTFARGTKNVPT